MLNEKLPPKIEKKIPIVANFKALGLGAIGIITALENWAEYFKLAEKNQYPNNTIYPDNLIIVAPPTIYIDNMVGLIGERRLPISVAAQDVSKFPEGSHTAETTAGMVKEAGAEYVIIGHSETRALDKLTNEDVVEKINRAREYKLTPIVCVRGMEEAYRSIRDRDYDGLIAYEPTAAIGTGKPADPNEADEVCSKLKEHYPHARILYGGSVNKDNVLGFMVKKGIDGVLVGQKSIDPKFFGDIIDTINNFNKGLYLFSYLTFAQHEREKTNRGGALQEITQPEVDEWIKRTIGISSPEQQKHILKTVLLEIEAVDSGKHKFSHDPMLSAFNMLFSTIQAKLEDLEKIKQ